MAAIMATHAHTNQTGIEVAAIFKRRTALTTQPSQLYVDSSKLAYKNADLFETAIRGIFD